MTFRARRSASFGPETLRELSVSFEPFGKSRLEDTRDLVVRQVGRVGNLLTRRRYEQSLLVRRYAAWAERTLGVFGPDTGWRVAEAARARGLGSVLFEPVLAAATTESRRPSLASPSDALAELSRQFELYTYRGEPNHDAQIWLGRATMAHGARQRHGVLARVHCHARARALSERCALRASACKASCPRAAAWGRRTVLQSARPSRKRRAA